MIVRRAVNLMVFADDWGRHPSSCQHLVHRLVDRYPVHWVDTIGTRRPKLDLVTLRRGIEKVRRWTQGSNGTHSLPPNLKVQNPWMWPWFRTALDRRLNRELLRRQLTPVIESSPAPTIAVTTLPIAADLVGVLPVERWVYYCVDDFGAWPGLDQEALRRLEKRLVARVDVLVAAGAVLQARLAALGRSSYLLTHGVDLEFWKQPRSTQLLPGLARLERPLFVFWGVVDRRMDTAFVLRLVSGLQRGTVVLVGRDENPDPALLASPRVARVPSVPFEDLPVLAREAAVLIMPYADLPVTRAMQPLKLKEYLATGRPTVVRDLPATRPWADCLDLADTPEAFARAVCLRAQTGLPPTQAGARARLAHETWAAKARLFEEWIFQHEPCPPLVRQP